MCGAELDTNSTCALDADNTFYPYFSEKCKPPLDEYPACVCKVRWWGGGGGVGVRMVHSLTYAMKFVVLPRLPATGSPTLSCDK